MRKIEKQAERFKLRAQRSHFDRKRHDTVRPDEQKWMWMAHHKLGLSFATIGSVLDRDPRTVRKAIANYKPTDKEKRRAQEPSAPPLGFDLSPLVSLAETGQKGLLAMAGQIIAAQLAMLEPRIMRSFGCHDIGLKQVRHVLSFYPLAGLDTWLDAVQSVESSLLRRKTIQQQILTGAKNGCKSLGPVELVENNFTLAAYHFLVRGDSGWLEHDRFQTLELDALGPPRLPIWCPLCDYNLRLQQWDTREFVCPRHDVPLIPKDNGPPIGVGYAAGVEVELYQEQDSVTPVEDIAMKYPSRMTLSLRVPKMLPFSEIVIAVGDTDSMPKLKSFVQDYFKASSLREETQQNEISLKRSYASLLEALRSAPASEETMSAGTEDEAKETR